MRLDTSYEERPARFEMTPMMDVVFLLLVYFIYAVLSMSVHYAVKVDLPQTGGSAELAPRPTVIALDRDNVLTFETRPVTLDEAVASALACWKDDGHPVIISADRRADVGDALKLLSGLRDAGVSAVTFQVNENAQ